MASKQVSADWAHFFDWMQMSPEVYETQVAYWDAVSYLNSYAIMGPFQVTVEKGQFGAEEGPVVNISVGVAVYKFNGFGLAMNPTSVVTQLMSDGVIPRVEPVKFYIPPSHTSPKPVVDISDLSKSVGQVLNGYDKETRELVYTFQGKVPLGTPVKAFGKDFVLVDSGSPWNRTGVWQVVN